jgi:hypothetical protein
MWIIICDDNFTYLNIRSMVNNINRKPPLSDYKFNSTSITIIVEKDLSTTNYFLQLVTTWVNEYKLNLKLQLTIVAMCWF